MGVRLGNWLTADQAKTLLHAPDIQKVRGKRDRAMLAVLLGCGLRRSELVHLTFELKGRALGDCRPDREGRPYQDGSNAGVGQSVA